MELEKTDKLDVYDKLRVASLIISVTLALESVRAQITQICESSKVIKKCNQQGKMTYSSEKKKKIS